MRKAIALIVACGVVSVASVAEAGWCKRRCRPCYKPCYTKKHHYPHKPICKPCGQHPHTDQAQADGGIISVTKKIIEGEDGRKIEVTEIRKLVVE